MKIVMVGKKNKIVQKFNKMTQQFLHLRQHLRFRFLQHVWRKQDLPWFLVLASDVVLMKSWMAALGEDFIWRSIQDYNDVWPNVNLYANSKMVLVEAPCGFWQNAGIKALGMLNRWQSFCKLLKRQRCLQPLNGVVLLLDLNLLKDDTACRNYLLKLTSVLQDLGEACLGELPIYVMIDGVCDLQGFEAYMAKLKPHLAEQAFGITFAIENAQSFDAYFDELTAQVDRKALAQLGRGDVRANAELLRFTGALQECRQNLAQLFSSLQSLRLHNIVLRGMYLMGFKTSMFVRAPFVDVVLKEASLGGVRRALLRWCELCKKKVFWFAGVFALIVLALMLVSSFVKLHPAPVQRPISADVSLASFNNISGAEAALVSLQEQWQNQMQHLLQKDILMRQFIQQNGIAVQQALQGIDASLMNVHDDSGVLALSVQLLNHQVAAFNQLQNLSQTAPKQLQGLFNALLQNVTRVVFVASEVVISDRWHVQMNAMCHKALVGFPFVSSDLDVSLQNFNSVFLNGMGVHDAGLDNLLMTLRVHDNAYGVIFVLPDVVRVHLALVSLIEMAFFNQGRMDVDMQWLPVLLSKNLAQFNLIMGSEHLMYQNGPRFVETLHWSSGQGVELQFTDLDGHVVVQDYQGAWALLRLLRHSQLQRLGVNHYQVTFSDDGFSAVYQVRLNRGDFAGVVGVFGFEC